MAEEGEYVPRMSPERAEVLRAWHDHAYEGLKARLPMSLSFMGLELEIDEDVFAPAGPPEGDPYHQAVRDEVRSSDRVLDMGTGCGISALLAARVTQEVVAVDLNPKAVACASRNAVRNGLADRITFIVSDVYESVMGEFDLMVFDPPFRWFRPRTLLEASTADENYRALTTFVSQARRHLRPDGRVLMNFGSSGDIDYLHSLIDRAGFKKKLTNYGQAIKHDITADYYVIRLTA